MRIVMFGLFIAGLMMAGCTTATEAAGVPAFESNVEGASLAGKVAALEQCVAALEARMQQGAPVVAIPAPRPGAEPLPRDWQRREFNGLPYYIIPLQEEPKKEEQPGR